MIKTRSLARARWPAVTQRIVIRASLPDSTSAEVRKVPACNMYVPGGKPVRRMSAPATAVSGTPSVENAAVTATPAGVNNSIFAFLVLETMSDPVAALIRIGVADESAPMFLGGIHAQP